VGRRHSPRRETVFDVGDADQYGVNGPCEYKPQNEMARSGYLEKRKGSVEGEKVVRKPNYMTGLLVLRGKGVS